MSRLDGHVCLVTGASRGIGAAIATSLANAGAIVYLHCRRNAALAEEIAAQMPGDDHQVLEGDLADPAFAAAAVGRVVAEQGRLDVLVNNAGVFDPHPPLGSDEAEWLEAWQQTLAVNLVAPAVLCQAAARVMADAGEGRIINIGSRGAFRGEPEAPAYGASKAGLHAMSQSLAVALAPANVQVFAVAPGFVETDMARALLDGDAGDGIRAQSPMNRVGTPEEVAEVVTFLAGTEASFMSGAILDINGASYLRS